MRLYVFDDHRIGVGVRDNGIADITALVGSVPKPDRMTELITRWRDVADDIRRAANGPADHVLSDVVIRPPQPRPRTIVAAPVNYVRHQAEMGGDAGVYRGSDVQTIETYAGFLKASSSIVGPDGAIELPFSDRRVDHEGEVGVVIGRTASRVPRERAFEYVFGYVPLLDITLRGAEDRSFRKSFDTFTPIGPAIVTVDEVADPADIAFRLSVNGEERQKSTTRHLIYDIAQLIELYTGAMTLQPGDLIATGTPEGVGPIASGDRIDLWIDDVGHLSMSVRAR
ncbi:fumarylacetoacetate hydrolase family protein [Mycobacterium sp. 663a-19]|uniref:fumarylacetoacetate hydrolase family protein n=1 Tax=Mycobacterium sp. 663a-19 TaxID=2986148 RepID=UPI002D1F4454|nr:fumarylacetoacetate hydrolase family protein [Mycobacterium sp. 663a-19]MEB3980072.1 fumarylacetoacetate hydrolase family protein [Mycobacterium sp. 663a-19]